MKFAGAEILLLDVGHGNTALVRSEAWVALIDVAPAVAVVNELDALEIDHIDDVLISHVESDHAGGAERLLRSPDRTIGRVWVNPDAATESATWKRLRTVLWDAQQRGEVIVQAALNQGTPEFSHGSVRVEVLHPDVAWALEGVGGAGTVNTMSTVVRVWLDADPAVLLAADLTAWGLNRMIENHTDVSARVLVFPHHGGHTEGEDDEAFARRLCEAVAPDVVVFSLGRRKHPNPRPEIMTGVRTGAPAAHVGCTQMSSQCAADGTIWSDAHLANRHAAGKAEGLCCLGTLSVRCVEGELVFDPPLAAHSEFIDAQVPVALCRRPTGA